MTFLRSILRLVPAIAIVAVGCGGAAYRSAGAVAPQSDAERLEVQTAGEEAFSPDEDAFADLLHADASFGEELSSVDCPGAWDLAEAICELAERVCSLGSDAIDSTERCSDGQQRCQRARTRVAERCPR